MRSPMPLGLQPGEPGTTILTTVPSSTIPTVDFAGNAVVSLTWCFSLNCASMASQEPPPPAMAFGFLIVSTDFFHFHFCILEFVCLLERIRQSESYGKMLKVLVCRQVKGQQSLSIFLLYIWQTSEPKFVPLYFVSETFGFLKKNRRERETNNANADDLSRVHFLLVRFAYCDPRQQKCQNRPRHFVILASSSE
jgi:hypothetical protein